MLTRDDIVAICPPPRGGQKRLVWNSYVAALTSSEGERLLKSYGVDTPNRLVGLMACVIAPETGLALLRESGAYSAERIVAVFGAHRHSSAITPDEANCIAALPVNADGTGPRADALFERAYGLGIKHCCGKVKGCTNRDRRGKLVACQARSLGNDQPGDGAKHPGVGLSQCTGKKAQQAMAKKIGCRVEDLAGPLYALQIMLIEWDERNCNAYADSENWVAIRSLFNTGKANSSLSVINGLPEMRSALISAKRVVTPSDFETAPDRNSVASSSLPQSMVHSTEGQAAGMTGSGGAYSFYEGTQSAVQKAAATGDLSAYSVLTNMLAEPLVWLGAMTIATAVYWFLKRRARLYIDGV